MNNDHIIIGGKRYRVEANWNALVAYLKMTGKNDMSGLSSFAELAPSDITNLMLCCIKEGMRLDGIVLDETFTAEYISERIGMSEVSAFLNIYLRQTTPQTEEEKANPKA